MHRSRAPLRKWFLAFFLVTKNHDLSAMRLAQELGVSYYMARRMVHEVRRLQKDQSRQTEVRSLMGVCKRLFREKPSTVVNPFPSSKVWEMLKELVSLLDLEDLRRSPRRCSDTDGAAPSGTPGWIICSSFYQASNLSGSLQHDHLHLYQEGNDAYDELENLPPFCR